MNQVITEKTRSSSISAAELGKLYRDQEAGTLRIVDVRTPVEFEEKHIEGSTLLPLDSLNEKYLAELGENPEAPLYILCRSGSRARSCIEKMHNAGIETGVLIEGGILAWESEQLPLTYGRGMISLERQVRIAGGALVFTGSLLAWLVHPGWLALPAFVGAGLVFAGVTDTCGMGLLIARMPWNQVNRG